MDLFDNIIKELRLMLDDFRGKDPFVTVKAGAVSPWPASGGKTIVMKTDTAVELGSPETASASLLLWTENHDLVDDGSITLAGKDLGAMAEGAHPFGRVVVLGVRGFSPENCHERQREMERLRFEIDLEGYMMRAVSQRGREWSRVGAAALGRGFSLAHLGAALARTYRELEYVTASETLFITSGEEDVRQLGTLGERAAVVVGAMNKMYLDDALDCASCGYSDVCGRVEGLREMRKTIAGRRDRG